MTGDVILALLGLVLTAATAIFVAAEFCLVAIDPAQLDAAADRIKPKRLAHARAAMKHLSTQLSGAQIGITLTTVLLGFTAQPALTRLLERILGGWPTAAAATGIAAAAAVIVVNAVSMVGGELVPKNVSLADPLAAAARVAGVQRAFTTAVRPAIWVLNGSANLVLRPFGVTPSEELSGARSAKELESLVKTSAEAGTLDRPLAGRLMGTLSLRELTAIDAMTDRTAVRTVARQATIEDAVRAARDSGHSTLPVTDGSKDVIVGLLRLRRAVAVPYESRGRVRVGAIMTPAPSVPETAPLGPVMVALRDAGAPMAVVVDEYGGTSGIVTLEDVVEEIVGEVADEHDGRTAAARPLPDGDWRVSGRLRPDELEELTGVRVPESHLYETLGGAVMAAIGRIPRAGDEAVVGGVRLRVEAVRRRRVEALRVSPPAPADGAAAEEADRP